MTASPRLFRFALGAFALVAVLTTDVVKQTAMAEPMKCSGEEKACVTACRKTARMAVSVCLTGCGTRLSACVKTGCWDDGTQRYCGLSRS